MSAALAVIANSSKIITNLGTTKKTTYRVSSLQKNTNKIRHFSHLVAKCGGCLI